MESNKVDVSLPSQEDGKNPVSLTLLFRIQDDGQSPQIQRFWIKYLSDFTKHF
jgi:hypothetical protein